MIEPPRRTPHSLHDRLKQKLEEMESRGVITQVNGPTDWVHNLVIVEKKDNSLRLCLDPRNLNKALKREHHQIPTTEDVISRLGGKRVFSIFDQKDSFWQVLLDKESALMCTFNTPFGRYCFNRMPFGLSSASEVLQSRNQSAFGDLEGVHFIADDMIVAAADEAQHDEIVGKLLKRARSCNVKFNQQKIQWKVSEVSYMGHVVTAEGLRPDVAKVHAVTNLPIPTSKADLQRALGVFNYLSRFVPNMSTITAPLRDFLKKDVQWQWHPDHEAAFNTLKQAISQAPVLKFFEPSKPSVIQADALKPTFARHGIPQELMADNMPLASV